MQMNTDLYVKPWAEVVDFCPMALICDSLTGGIDDVVDDIIDI